MNPRDRVWHSIRHRQPDRVPYHLSYTVPARRKLEAYYGTTDLDHVLDNHLVKYKPRRPDAWQEVRPDYWRDEFGVVWNRTVDKDIGVVEGYLLKERRLDGYTFPDPHDPLRYEALPAFLTQNPTRFRVVNIGFSLFERAWSLRGMANLMIDMLEAPVWVEELLDAIVAFDLGLIEEVSRHDIDAVMFGDDWGHQRGLLFGAPLWRRLIRPRLAQLYGAVHKGGKAVLIHSCGQVQELFPELIELGLDVFNPFQPEVMDLGRAKKEFGADLSFYGGMSIQRILPFGTPQQVRDEARRLMDEIGRGGGFIIAPSHDMPGDIPLENLVAFVEAVRTG
jgi:uroporphyrinogen decarboxylase